MNDCKYFREAANSGLLKPPQFEEPPEFYQLLTYKWFLTAYVQDILPRIDETKASITTFGSIIKMDSTKKVVRKLAGHSTGTAALQQILLLNLKIKFR